MSWVATALVYIVGASLLSLSRVVATFCYNIYVFPPFFFRGTFVFGSKVGWISCEDGLA